MARMNWKQCIGEGGLTPQRGKELLADFRYPTEIDKKGRLLIVTGGMSKTVIGFEDDGPDSTIVGVSAFKFKPITIILLIILLLAFLVPAVIVGLNHSSRRKKIFLEAVQVMNQGITS